MSKSVGIVIPVFGLPYITKVGKTDESWLNHIKELIDETNDGLEFCVNNEFIKIVINPMFIQMDKRWSILETLLRKTECNQKVNIYAPDIYWKYNPNSSVLQVIKRQPIRHIFGNVFLKINETEMKKVCKDYKDVFAN